RCGNDADFARELIESFLETVPQSAAGITAALSSGQMPRLAIEAHGLKGASLTMGAEDLVDACRQLEDVAQNGDSVAAQDATAAVLDRLAELTSVLEAKDA